MMILACSIGAMAVALGAAQPAATTLPAVAENPLEQSDTDPLLALAEQTGERDAFEAAIAAAIARHGRVRSADALVDAADAASDAAWMGIVPDVQLSLQSRHSIASDFSGAAGTAVENATSRSRVDANFQIRQPLVDFGRTSGRIDAAGARLRAARSELDATREQVALAAIAAWYDVYAYRSLIALSDALVAEQEGLVADLQTRIDSGVAAEGDIARMRSSLALARTNRARYRRMLGGAEASYIEMTGQPAPEGLLRAPAPQVPAITAEMAAFLARRSPSVMAAEAEARAARGEAKSAKGERLPVLEGSIDGGRYGLVRDEFDGDYDVRGTISLRQSFFTGAFPRARQADARARAYEAQADAIADEAARAAAVAWADVEALETELAALSDNYIASRQTRDVLAQRFAASRGDLFDVMQAQDAYFAIAGRYVEVLGERDAARWVLLARTGRLLDALGLDHEGEPVSE